MNTYTLARRAARLFRDGYMPREIRHANVRKWVAAVQRLGDKWLLAVPVTKGSLHD